MIHKPLSQGQGIIKKLRARQTAAVYLALFYCVTHYDTFKKSVRGESDKSEFVDRSIIKQHPLKINFFSVGVNFLTGVRPMERGFLQKFLY